MPRSYFFCRDSCGPPYILFSKKQMIKTVSFIRMKKYYYSYNDRLFSFLNSCAQLPKCQFCHTNAMFDSEFYRRKIIKNLRTLLRKLVEIRNYLKIIFLTKYIGTNRLFGKVRGSVTSVKSRGVLNHPQSFVGYCSYFVFLK